MALIVETCVARHTGDRSEQQDRAEIFAHPNQPGTMMAVLADGMGGHTGGALAAEQVLLRAKQNFEAYQPSTESPRQLLEGIISEAHLMIRLARFTSEKEPHSTAVALMLQPDRISWIHCGDSRLYHFRGAQTLSRSQDHSLVAELQRRGRLDEAGAQIHPRRNVLLSCLGSDSRPQVELGQAVPPVAGDSFLLCSDGLWAHFSDHELADIIAAGPARRAAESLVEMARKRCGGAGDNISLVIIKLRDARTPDAPVTPS
jgi:serine/threonine protein phosphatase PrpC